MKYSDGTYDYEWDGGETMSVTKDGKHLFDHDMVADAKVEGDKITLTKPPFTLSSMKTFAAEAAGLVSEEMFFDADAEPPADEEAT